MDDYPLSDRARRRAALGYTIAVCPVCGERPQTAGKCYRHGAVARRCVALHLPAGRKQLQLAGADSDACHAAVEVLDHIERSLAADPEHVLDMARRLEAALAGPTRERCARSRIPGLIDVGGALAALRADLPDRPAAALNACRDALQASLLAAVR